MANASSSTVLDFVDPVAHRGLECRDTGVGAATGGVVDARVGESRRRECPLRRRLGPVGA